MIKKLAFALCALAVPAAVNTAVAQEAVLEQFYGSGVHRYFANDYSRAEADLSSAIGGGSKDPRAYYFRALAKLRSGQDATTDLQKAAALEVADVNQSYPVGKSLERVQGSTRATIERYRALARATAMTRQQRRDAERYNQLEQAETKVLRGPAPATRASAIEPAPVAPKAAAPNVAVPAPPAAEDPFAEPAAPAAAAPGPAASGRPNHRCPSRRFRPTIRSAMILPNRRPPTRRNRPKRCPPTSRRPKHRAGREERGRRSVRRTAGQRRSRRDARRTGRPRGRRAGHGRNGRPLCRP